jgi:hypothetical protein
MGAGILPITIHKGAILFLFGRERYNNQWSDFKNFATKIFTQANKIVAAKMKLNNYLKSVGIQIISKK